MPGHCFITKDTPTVHAVRWNQVVGEPDAVSSLYEGEEGTCEICEAPLTHHGCIIEQEHLVCPGDWIVTPEGVENPQSVSMSAAEFEAMYEER